LKRAYTFSLMAFSCQELFRRKNQRFRHWKEDIILDSLQMSSKNFKFFNGACEIVPGRIQGLAYDNAEVRLLAFSQ